MESKYISLRSADDIDVLPEEEEEEVAVFERRDETCTKFKIDISAAKNKIQNRLSTLVRQIRVNVF